MSAALKGRHRRRIICAANSRGERVSAQLDTIDGWVMTERAITADKSVAPSITAALPRRRQQGRGLSGRTALRWARCSAWTGFVGLTEANKRKQSIARDGMSKVVQAS